MLALEIQDAHEEAQSAPRRLALEALIAKLGEVRILETERLTSALAVLDSEQIAAVALSFREQRLELERRIASLRNVVADERRIPTNPKHLIEEDPALLQDALNRSLNWIALTHEGVIAYSKLDRYISGRYVNKRKGVAGGLPTRSVSPPELETLSECQAWITDRVAFIAGRRYAMGEVADRLTDLELCPFVDVP